MIRKSATSAARKSTRTQRRTRSNLRDRVAAAFREIARGVDERTARDRTHAFYRSSGADWARPMKLLPCFVKDGFLWVALG